MASSVRKLAATAWLLLALTRQDGVPVWIDSDQIVTVTYGGDGVCESRSTTTVMLQNGAHQCVREGVSIVVGATNNAKTHGKD